MPFQLHPKLLNDTFLIDDLNLSQLLLMNDQRFPWLILVPKRKNILEIYELPVTDQLELLREITHLSKQLKSLYKADKINIASFGNIVPQLHVHIIARKKTDMAWPNPIFGIGKPKHYTKNQIRITLERLKNNLQ